MTTAEQVQEALQQLQAQGTRIAALETQLKIEQTRAQTAELERSALIQTLVTKGWSGDKGNSKSEENNGKSKGKKGKDKDKNKDNDKLKQC